MKEANDIDKILRSKLEGFEVKGSSSLRFRFYWLIMKKRILGTLLLVFLLAALGVAIDMMWPENVSDADERMNQKSELKENPETVQKNKTALGIEKKTGEVKQAQKTKINNADLKSINNSTTDIVEQKPEIQVQINKNTRSALVNDQEKSELIAQQKPKVTIDNAVSKSDKMMKQATAYEADEQKQELALAQMESLPSGPFISLYEIALLPDRGLRDDYYLPEKERIPRFGISLSAGPSIYRNTYQVGNLEDGLYKYESLNNHPLEDMNAELGISYRFGNWEVGSGITYQNYQASFSITKHEHSLDTEQSYYRKDTIWGYIYDPPILGKPIILGYDSTYIEVYKTETNHQSTVARFAYLGIPLKLGYRFEMGKYYLKPWVGMNFSFLASASGELPLEANGELIELEPGNKYLESFISRFNTGLEAAYAIRQEQYLFINVVFERSLNRTYMNYPLRTKDQQAGISLGYKITF